MQGFLRKLTTWLQSDPRPKHRRTRFHLELLEDRCLLSNAPLPLLSSDPGAPASLYLDFLGSYEPTWGAYSNVTTPQFHLDGTGPGFTPHEIAVIDEVWERVSEIYSPFNINVTTAAPANLGHDSTQTVDIGGSYNDWFHAAAGGITYVGSFTNPSLPNVSHVFVDGTDGVAQYIAIAAAHEAGHGFGLYHQSVFDASGNLLQEYNPGDSSAAPIMGLAYSAARALWWVGASDVNGVETIQNDEAVIAGSANGFGYRPDYYGQSEETATALTVSNGQASDAGVIDTPTSADYFTFTTSGGAVSFTVGTVAVGPTLHARLELYSSTGLVAIGDSTASLGQSISATLAAGKYYVVVASYGGNGDVGQYTLSGQVPPGTTGATTSAFTQAATFSLLPNQALYAQDAAGNWLLLSPPGTILSISTSTDSTGHAEVFALATNHSLWVFRQGAWTVLSPAGTINALSASTGDVVFALASDQSLWVNSHNAWAILSAAGTINAIAASPSDLVFALASDSSLWLHGAAGWSELSPTGTILSVSAGVNASGTSEAFVLDSNDTYWMYTLSSGWALSTASAAPVSAVPVAPKAESSQKSLMLMEEALNTKDSNAAAGKVVVNPLLPHQPFMPMCMCPWCVAARLAAQKR
jgi:hypothetical protein